MDPHTATTLLHLVGFVTALALYVMLAAMTVGAAPPGSDGQRRADRIPLATAALGIVWNAGALVMYGLPGVATPVWLPVLAFTALYFLPAVVVHSALTVTPRTPGRAPTASAFIAAAYVLSGGAALINVIAAVRHHSVPSRPGLWALAAGYAAIIGLLVLYSRRQPAWRRALPVVALAAFAAMVVHLSHHSATADTWPVELLGHHASLPLVLVILYQDYRFALADLFLKRVVTLLVVTGVAALLYSTVVVPVVLPKLGAPAGDPLAAALLIALWVGTALTYPALRSAVARFVDRAILGRSDAQALLSDLGADTAALNTEDAILDAACAALAPALSATRVTWSVVDPSDDAAPVGGRDARVRVPVIDSPGYRLTIGPLRGGRRLLSDDQTLLEGVARLAARRIDGVRVARERFARDIRERDMQQLATEAELRALRAQINPHFLFNALTTIGYLVRAAPDRAIETLLRLTDVLRAVLKRSDGEFATLGEEMEIVSAYLAIERARFEDRLAVTIDVPDALAGLRVPPLVLQPLIENAVKHGIAPLLAGGRITVTARTEGAPSGSGGSGSPWLRLTVTDTGMGADPAELSRRRRTGIGLTNIERRLERHYGADASIEVRTALGVGTTVEVRLPATLGTAPRSATPARTHSLTA
jgi:signal transduction histidine kinase